MITVLRYPSEADWTLSEFYINDKLYGFGIEDEYRSMKVHGETRIPNGTYEMVLTASPKFSKYYYTNSSGVLNKLQTPTFNTLHNLITLKNVPNFSRVLWHWGNTDDDTEGCYIVGSKLGVVGAQKAVLESKKKYEQIYPIIFNLIKTGTTHVVYKDKYPVLS